MTETMQQILMLILFAAAMLFANLKAGETWVKLLTIAGFLGASGLAGYLLVEWVLL